MVDIDDLEVVYPTGVCAIAPTTLRFEAGAFTVLIGASGAGKSTLLRCLNGLVRPTRGRVTVDNIGEIADRGRLRTHRRRTGMVFQQHQLIGRASVLTNVLTGRLGFHSGVRTLLPFAAAEKHLALDAIDRVGLIDFALRRADQLSGGQQQRVGIARALVQQPTLMLADEPVASLDPATAERLLGLLHRICKADGISAVVSLHQLDFARRYADRIIGIAQGTVVFDGAPTRLGEAEIVRIYGGRTPAMDDEFETEPQLMTGTYA